MIILPIKLRFTDFFQAKHVNFLEPNFLKLQKHNIWMTVFLYVADCQMLYRVERLDISINSFIENSLLMHTSTKQKKGIQKYTISNKWINGKQTHTLSIFQSLTNILLSIFSVYRMTTNRVTYLYNTWLLFYCRNGQGKQEQASLVHFLIYLGHIVVL